MLTTAQSSESNHKVLISKARAVEKTKLEAVTKAEASLKEKQQKLEQSDAFKAVVIAKQLLKEGQSALKSAKARTAKAETELRQHCGAQRTRGRGAGKHIPPVAEVRMCV